MKWPFGRRRPPSDAQPPSLPSPVEIMMHTGPNSVYKTEYEPLIESLLQRADEQAKLVASGDKFTVTLTDEEREDCADFNIVGRQVLLRTSRLKGVMPHEAYNGTLTFYKV